MHLLLPRTDRAVLVEAIVVVATLVVALGIVWRRSELRLLVIGLGVFVLALMALRALH